LGFQVRGTYVPNSVLKANFTLSFAVLIFIAQIGWGGDCGRSGCLANSE
jgi:hypothetical protein